MNVVVLIAGSGGLLLAALAPVLKLGDGRLKKTISSGASWVTSSRSRGRSPSASFTFLLCNSRLSLALSLRSGLGSRSNLCAGNAAIWCSTDQFRDNKLRHAQLLCTEKCNGLAEKLVFPSGCITCNLVTYGVVRVCISICFLIAMPSPP